MYDGKPCPECDMTGEYRTTENPDGRWDYWDIGGSSSGRLSPGYHPNQNPEGERNWEECGACKGAGTGCGRCGETGVATSDGKSPFGLDIVQLSDVADNIKVYPPTALVTSNGEWHQVGFFDWDDEGDPDRDSWRVAIAEIVDAPQGSGSGDRLRAVPRIEGPDLPFLIGVTDAFASRQAPRQSSTLHESCRHPEFATAIFRKPPSRTAPVREAAGSLYPFSIRWVAISRKSVKISAATRVSSRPIIPDSKSLCAASRTPKPTLTESGTATLHRSSSKRSTPEDQRVGPRDRCSTGQGPDKGYSLPGAKQFAGLRPELSDQRVVSRRLHALCKLPFHSIDLRHLPASPRERGNE